MTVRDDQSFDRLFFVSRLLFRDDEAFRRGDVDETAIGESEASFSSGTSTPSSSFEEEEESTDEDDAM